MKHTKHRLAAILLGIGMLFSASASAHAQSQWMDKVTLYFPNAGGSLAVPVTRRISGRPGLYQLVSALVSGARSGRLRSCFPENTLLLGATLENGTVTVNLSEDFRASAQTEGLFSLAYRTVWLTLSREFDFDSLRFQINGVDFNPEEVGSALLPNPAA